MTGAFYPRHPRIACFYLGCAASYARFMHPMVKGCASYSLKVNHQPVKAERRPRHVLVPIPILTITVHCFYYGLNGGELGLDFAAKSTKNGSNGSLDTDIAGDQKRNFNLVFSVLGEYVNQLHVV
ncbi:hypothetical protein K438DRAFT_1751000 [Mycena galopus ATCC 62051]|nr:hypothetical protein K438DRAFT_1751000 [Mycena galopus ATCC 62051]